MLLGTTPLQMVPIFPGETGELNLLFDGDVRGCFLDSEDSAIPSGLQQRHTEQKGSPRQDAREHIGEVQKPAKDGCYCQRVRHWHCPGYKKVNLGP